MINETSESGVCLVHRRPTCPRLCPALMERGALGEGRTLRGGSGVVWTLAWAGHVQPSGAWHLAGKAPGHFFAAVLSMILPSLNLSLQLKHGFW